MSIICSLKPQSDTQRLQFSPILDVFSNIRYLIQHILNFIKINWVLQDFKYVTDYKKSMLKNRLPYYNTWGSRSLHYHTISKLPHYSLAIWFILMICYSNITIYVTGPNSMVTMGTQAVLPFAFCDACSALWFTLLSSRRWWPFIIGSCCTAGKIVLEIHYHILKNNVNIILNFFQQFYLITIHYIFNIQLMNMLYSFAQCVLHNSLWHDV